MSSLSCTKSLMMECKILTGPRPMVPPGPVPLSLDKHFDFLEWSPDGDSLLVGTSNLTSRSWAGSIWVFDSDTSKTAESSDGWQPKADECIVGASMDCGVTVGRFLRCSNQLVLGCDSGAVQVIALKQYPVASNSDAGSGMKLEGEGSLSEHHDTVLDMDDLGGDGVHFVSCSQDKSIKVWDLESLISTRTFSPAHGHIVTSVRARPSEAQSFASCARDGSALLWDTRDDQPASSLVNPCGIGLTSLSWVNDMLVVVGGVDGKLTLIDVRNPNENQAKVQLENRSIHLIRSIPTNTGLIAASQDNSTITVVEFGGESPKIQFTNDSHKDFVRGLVWNPQNLSLWSCGWDSKVISHSLEGHSNGLS